MKNRNGAVLGGLRKVGWNSFVWTVFSPGSFGIFLVNKYGE